MKLGVAETPAHISAISTGLLTLDMALGIGVCPRGRVIEISGPESSGKTTLCLNGIAEAQKTGDAAAFIDAEYALDISYTKKHSVQTDDLLIVYYRGAGLIKESDSK